MVNARQADLSDHAPKNRILELLNGREAKWLAEATQLSASTISDAINGRMPRVDRAIRISTALEADVEHVFGAQPERRLSAKQPSQLVDALDADWIEVPEYSLLEIDEHGKLDPIATTLMRKDWLYSTLGDTSGIWVSRLFARYDPLDIDYGAALFCKDHKAGERLAEGLYYLFRTNGEIIMAPYTSRDTGAPGDAVHRRDIGKEDDQYEPVARVIGQLARPI